MDELATDIELVVLPDADALGAAAAAIIAAEAAAADSEFTIALAGGTTPRRVYEALSAEPFRSRIAWDTWSVWWGDERAVPPTDPMSNYALAAASLLDAAPIPPSHVHRIRGELGSQAAAASYESEIVEHFGDGIPRFDLILLGIGEDGHTASLFPGAPATQETRHSVLTSVSSMPPHDRVTLTLPVINAARKALFLVSGREKADALRRVIAADQEDAQQPPAALVRPVDGVAQFVVDASAAVLLTGAARR